MTGVRIKKGGVVRQAKLWRSLALVGVLSGCSAQQTPAPQTAEQQGISPGDSQERVAADPSPSGELVPGGGAEVLGTLVVDSLDRVLPAALAYVRPHLPAAFQSMVEPEVLRKQLLAQFNKDLDRIIDSSLPFALAAIYPGSPDVMPDDSWCVAVPVKDQPGLMALLAADFGPPETTTRGDQRFGRNKNQIVLRFRDRYVFMAPTEGVWCVRLPPFCLPSWLDGPHTLPGYGSTWKLSVVITAR